MVYFMISRFCMNISMIPSICKSTEIKSFAKATEKINRMRIQTYHPFQTITSFTKGFYLIYHHFPLNCWLATEEGLWESFEGSQDLCYTHCLSTDFSLEDRSHCTGNWLYPNNPCHLLEHWKLRKSEFSAKWGPGLNGAWSACLTEFSAKLISNYMSPWWSGLM